jgi:hypothetical protein
MAIGLLILTSCGRAASVTIADCFIESVRVGSGWSFARRWVITNTGQLTIDATRTGVAAFPGALDSPWDDDVPIPPGGVRHIAEPPTTPIARRYFTEPTPLTCEVTAIRYHDGSEWIARPGLAGPVLHRGARARRSSGKEREILWNTNRAQWDTQARKGR